MGHLRSKCLALGGRWWVSVLNAIYPDRRLMPPPDFKRIVVGAKSGHSRDNKSWMIGRLVRDYEQRATPHADDKSFKE